MQNGLGDTPITDLKFKCSASGWRTVHPHVSSASANRSHPIVQLIDRSKAIQGWAAGTPADSDDTSRFAEPSGGPVIETYSRHS
jgi:hypothetical protein